MTTLLALAVLSNLQADLSPASFFPVTPGAKWVYEEVSKQGKTNMTKTFTDTCGEAVEILGESVHPFTTKGLNGAPNTVHYQVDEEGVNVFMTFKSLPSQDEDDNIIPPQDIVVKYPVLRLGAKTENWSYTGVTQFAGDPVDMIMNATSKRLGKKKYFGSDRESLEVKMTVNVNLLPTDDIQTLQGATMRSEQTAIYAQGIGLVDFKEVITIGKDKMERTRKLKSYSMGT